MQQNIKKYEVNGETVWRGELLRIKSVRQEKPIHFYIRPLNIADAEAMGEFSKAIYENLRSGEECFIHKHSAEYYYQVFQNQKVRYIGVFVGKNLVGMSYLMVCNNRDELEEELPHSSYDFFKPERNNGATKIASFGGDSVLPDFRGNNFNAIMIKYRMEEAKKQGCTDCTSIVDRNNRWNMLPYFSCRFNLFATAIDPTDGGQISLLHKPIEKETVLSEYETRISVPYTYLERIDTLIKNGFIGIEFNKDNAYVTFAHSSYYNEPRRCFSRRILNAYQQKRLCAV